MVFYHKFSVNTSKNICTNFLKYLLKITLFLDTEYDYYTAPEEAPRPLLFTGIMYASCAFIVILMLVTLLGPIIKDCPLRWHTLNFCCWNCFQVLIFANCGDESEFSKFLKNDYIDENCVEIQIMTLAVFYHSRFLFI